jgi:beta-lactamase regulating signal transducer with metallopeptidase domain
MKKEDRKPKIVDEGITIANMNVEGFRWYQSKETIKRKKIIKDLGLSKRERRAMIIGAYFAYMPIFFGILAGFTIAYGIFYLWAITR